MREHDLPVEEVHDPIWSFLLPILVDESLPSVQIFFQKKQLLNQASEASQSVKPDSKRFIGSFLKFPPGELHFDTFGQHSVKVGVNQTDAYYGGHHKLNQKLTGDHGRVHKQNVVDQYRLG